MELPKLLLALFTFVAMAWAATSEQAIIFHGTSSVTFPSDDTSSRISGRELAANFFSYMTEKGHFSFGWWVSSDGNGNTSHCQPDSDSFHWLELAETISCDDKAKSCLYRLQNVPIRRPDDGELAKFSAKAFEYVIQPPMLAEGDKGQIALTYVDGDGDQIQGMSTMHKISGEQQTSQECQKALRTLKRSYEIHDIDLGFEIGNPCAQDRRNTGHEGISEL